MYLAPLCGKFAQINLFNKSIFKFNLQIVKNQFVEKWPLALTSNTHYVFETFGTIRRENKIEV